ncbi:MAG: PD-(D/E)XK nuclease-like domain-containing protein [Acidobacteriota bacterium]
MAVYENLTHDQYSGLSGWNWSLIKRLSASPKHLRFDQLFAPKDRPAWQKGRALHAAVFESESFAHRYRPWPGVRRGKAYDGFKEKNPGVELMTEKDYAEVVRGAESVLSVDWVTAKLLKGRPEVSFTWNDPETGLPCKGRADWLTDKFLMDLKGVRAGIPVETTIAKYQYHGQMAHYAAGLRANGIEVEGVYIVAVETSGPMDVSIYELDNGAPEGALYEGEKVRARYMEQLAECVESDEWPGRQPFGPERLALPPWALSDVASELEFDEIEIEEGAMP